MPNSAETGRTPLRIITAAAIFDGHDAAIGIFRRIFQSMGCEVIHLGHDRGADEVAKAAIQEDAHTVLRLLHIKVELLKCSLILNKF